MYKLCSKCKKIKLRELDFQLSKINKDGLRSWCRECHNKDLKIRKKKYIESLKIQGCALCSYIKCFDALEFHHVLPLIKEFGISGIGTRGKTNQQVADEIAKCILLCANCHREQHYQKLTLK